MRSRFQLYQPSCLNDEKTRTHDTLFFKAGITGNYMENKSTRTLATENRQKSGLLRLMSFLRKPLSKDFNGTQKLRKARGTKKIGL